MLMKTPARLASESGLGGLGGALVRNSDRWASARDADAYFRRPVSVLEFVNRKTYHIFSPIAWLAGKCPYATARGFVDDQFSGKVE